MSESAMDTEQSVTCGNRVANQIWTLSVGSWLKPRPCPSSMVSIATDASLIADDNEDECGEEGKDEFDSSTQSTEGRLRKAVIDVDTSESALTLRARVGLDTKNKLVDRLREEVDMFIMTPECTPALCHLDALKEQLNFHYHRISQHIAAFAEMRLSALPPAVNGYIPPAEDQSHAASVGLHTTSEVSTTFASALDSMHLESSEDETDAALPTQIANITTWAQCVGYELICELLVSLIREIRMLRHDTTKAARRRIANKKNHRGFSSSAALSGSSASSSVTLLFPTEGKRATSFDGGGGSDGCVGDDKDDYDDQGDDDNGDSYDDERNGAVGDTNNLLSLEAIDDGHMQHHSREQRKSSNSAYSHEPRTTKPVASCASSKRSNSYDGRGPLATPQDSNDEDADDYDDENDDDDDVNEEEDEEEFYDDDNEDMEESNVGRRSGRGGGGGFGMRAGKRTALPSSARVVLDQWLSSHWHDPYPTPSEKKELARKCNITVNQVNHWFINARVRRWRPTMEKAASKALSSGSSKALAALVKDCGEHNPFAKFLGELKVESGSRKQPT